MKHTAIDISSAQPKGKGKPKQSQPPAQPVFPPERQRILDLLALGSTVRAAVKAVGVARSSFYNWIKEDPLYGEIAQRVRGIHIADIDDALHEVDSDARALIHRIIVDESITPGTRLRAALSALNRKGPGWLPRELPPYEYGPQRKNSPLITRPLGSSPYPTGRTTEAIEPTISEQDSPSANTEANPSESGTSPQQLHSSTPTELGRSGSENTCNSPIGVPSQLCAAVTTSGQWDVAPKSPHGAFNNCPGRKTGENQPSESRPPKPRQSQSAPGATVAAPSVNASRADRAIRSGKGKTVQNVQLETFAHNPIQLTANQSLPSAAERGVPAAVGMAGVQKFGAALTQPGSSEFGPGFPPSVSLRSRPDTVSTRIEPGPPESGDSTASLCREVGENHLSEARPPQPRLTEEASGALVAAPAQSTPRDNPESPDLDPGAPQDDGAMRLDTAFFCKYTVLRHEKADDFAHLLREMTAIYEPQSNPEELQVLRIAQAHWNLRRIETMQTAVLDSTVDQMRCSVRDIHPAAALAATFLGKDPSDQVWFIDRMQNYRKFHEEYLSRQEGLLFRYKESREVSALREAKANLLAAKARPAGTGLPDRILALEEIAEWNFRATLAAETEAFETAPGEDPEAG